MSSRDVRLLLVAEDPSQIQVMGRMLADYPDQRFATSGEAALRMARETTPDLIVLDLDMPGMAGLDLCQALKVDPLLARVPIVFVSRHGAPVLDVADLEKGGADVVTKPLVAAQLVARVRARLNATQPLNDLDDRLPLGSVRTGVAQKPRILIVDDDIASIHILHYTLASMGDFHFAKSGEKALQLARSLVPDLILLDAHMPGIDGFDVCKSLKSDEAFRYVPIVFVTRFSDPRYETRAFDLGAADFITKPYTAAVLQARVRNLLDLKRRTVAELQAARDHWRRVGDARVADIVGAASDAIITCASAGEVVLINAAACRMFGVDNVQTVGSPVQALLGDVASNGDPAHGDSARVTMQRADGSSFPAEVSVSAVGAGTDRLTTVMLRDISDRERLEAETRSRIEAETAGRTKTLMMSYIAHEMGNPLNGLLGFAQRMEADTGHPLAPEQAKRLEYIMTSGRQLQGLMRDVLDLGRFETGKLDIELQPVDALDCAQEAIAAIKGLADRAGVTVCLAPVAPPLRIAADADRLYQCLLNLLTNAIKYNRPGGWARIEVTADAQQAAIAVHDNGIGMDAAQRQHLFEPFNRLGRQRGGAPGAGLGLVITRQLVEAMSGQLRVESEPETGSCFSILLPMAAGGAAS